MSVLLGASLRHSNYMIVCKPVLLADVFCYGAEQHLIIQLIANEIQGIIHIFRNTIIPF